MSDVSITEEQRICESIAKRVRYEDGKLIWVDSMQSWRNGKVVGDAMRGKYRQIQDGSRSKVPQHRLIFFMHYGYLPAIVDHEDRDTLNNRIGNLRPATKSQNSANCKVPSRNKSGHKGVDWRAPWSKWRASLRINGKTISFGSFDKLEDAIAARKRGEEKYYGEFATK